MTNSLRIFFLFYIGLTNVSSRAFADSFDRYSDRPKLIVLLVIDQFRADYLTRFEKEFLSEDKKGFRFLMKNGAYYPFANYDILQCMTGPGHAMISTGSYPYSMGIPINEWYDGRDRVYSVEDGTYATIGNPTDTHRGTSPKLLKGTTFGDELKNAGYSSKVVSVALKDRASILMGGHRADLALWFDKKAGWTSSTYYLHDGKLPAWIDHLNADASVKSCVLENPCSAELTVNAALEAATAFHLGSGPATDVLAISFSGHDIAGHKFGPNSPQLKQMTLAEDKSLSILLTALDRKISGGLKNAVVVLTADHGTPPSPEFLKDSGIETGRISQEEIIREIEKKLSDKFASSTQEKWIGSHYEFNFFLHPAPIAKYNLKPSQIENEAKEILLSKPGISYVVTKSDFAQGKLPPGIQGRQLANSYYPGRSGDLIAIVRPYFVTDTDTTTHMTGYSYDRTVPAILYGKNIRPGVKAARMEIVDLAPTLAFIAGTIPPSLSEGRVLGEALAF